MTGSKILIVHIVVICFNHFIHGVIQVATRSHTIDKGLFFANTHSFHEGNLVYAICDSNSKPITHCKVVQEKYPYKEIAQSCYVMLKNQRNSGLLTIVVAALGKDKAVLIWKYKDGDSTIVTVGTIYLKSCEMNKVKIPNSELSVLLELYFITKFVTYDDDSFDIFYNDPKAVNPLLYKMQLNGNGTLKREPEIVNIESGRYLFVSSVATGSPSKGHVYEKKSLTDLSATPKYHLWLVKLNGTRKLLAEYNGFPLSDVSAANNFISLCFKPESSSRAKCNQYDEYGNALFTATLTDDTSRNIQLLTTHNLHNGGMLIMYGTNNCIRPKNCSNETAFELVKIGADGRKMSSLHAQKLPIPVGKIRASYIYENGNKGYCAAVIVRDVSYSELSLKERIPIHLTIVVNCFSEYDFTVWY